jgi:hypothetical protein
MVWALFSEPQFRAIDEMVKFGSERIIAIVGGTLLDEALRLTLKERLRESGVSNKLFRVNGALGNLGPKIDLAYLLYAIDKPTRAAAEGISEIRNFFAHNLDASFNSEHNDMLDALGQLTLHDGRTHYPFHQGEYDTEHKIPAISNNVDKFVINLQLVLLFLMRDRSRHVTWSSYMLPGWTPTAPQEMPQPEQATE